MARKSYNQPRNQVTGLTELYVSLGTMSGGAQLECALMPTEFLACGGQEPESAAAEQIIT